MSALSRTREGACACAGEPGFGPCEGTIHAHHHTGGRGRGQKADDERTFPLCWKHHNDFHSATGGFRDKDKAWRREWQDRMVMLHAPIDFDSPDFPF